MDYGLDYGLDYGSDYGSGSKSGSRAELGGKSRVKIKVRLGLWGYCTNVCVQYGAIALMCVSYGAFTDSLRTLYGLLYRRAVIACRYINMPGYGRLRSVTGLHSI